MPKVVYHLALIGALVAGIVFPWGAAQAECADTIEWVDHIYCASSDYAHAQSRLNQVYVRAMSLLNQKQGDQLSSDEIGWRKIRNDVCSIRNDQGEHVNLRCMTDWTKARTETLTRLVQSCEARACDLDILYQSDD